MNGWAVLGTLATLAAALFTWYVKNDPYRKQAERLRRIDALMAELNTAALDRDARRTAHLERKLSRLRREAGLSP